MPMRAVAATTGTMDIGTTPTAAAGKAGP